MKIIKLSNKFIVKYKDNLIFFLSFFKYKQQNYLHHP